MKTALVWRDPSDAQKNRVMFQGDEVAAVAADTEEHAIDAARLVKVEYEVLPHVTVVEAGAGRHGAARFSRAETCALASRSKAAISTRASSSGLHARGNLFDPRHHARLHGDRTARCANGTATS